MTVIEAASHRRKILLMYMLGATCGCMHLHVLRGKLLLSLNGNSAVAIDFLSENPITTKCLQTELGDDKKSRILAVVHSSRMDPHRRIGRGTTIVVLSFRKKKISLTHPLCKFRGLTALDWLTESTGNRRLYSLCAPIRVMCACQSESFGIIRNKW